MNIGIIYKEEDRLISNTAKKVISDLKSAKHKVTVISKFHKPGKVEFVLTLGGDGTTLRAARIMAKTGIPLLSVHLGGLGLLTEISLLEIEKSINQIRAKNFSIDSRMMLDAEVKRLGKTINSSIALNDVVITKSAIARTIKLEAYTNGQSMASYTGDGLIVATPTGSTAYNFAAFGPIVPTHGKSFIITPICSHRGANRSIVTEDPVTIKIKKGDDNLLTVDGQEIFKLKTGDEVLIKKSKHTTRFIRLKDYNIWDLLRTKLYWG